MTVCVVYSCAYTWLMTHHPYSCTPPPHALIRRQALPDGSELKEPVILGGVQVLHYSRKQDKGSPKNGGTARPSSWKQGLKLPWKKRNPPPPKRQDWEI